MLFQLLISVRVLLGSAQSDRARLLISPVRKDGDWASPPRTDMGTQYHRPFSTAFHPMSKVKGEE